MIIVYKNGKSKDIDDLFASSVKFFLYLPFIYSSVYTKNAVQLVE